MRTKTILLAAAAMTAGVLSSHAQVFSANIVGYTTSVGVSVPSGFAMIANPLDLDLTGTNNTVVSAVGTNVPGGTSIFAWDAVGQTFFSPAVFNGAKKAWLGDLTDANVAMQPGNGFFIQTPSSNSIVFVGQVMQNIGSRTHTLPANNSIASSIVPVAGPLTNSILNYAATGGDQVLQWDPVGQQFQNASVYNGAKKSWLGNGVPNVQVGEAFFISTVAGGSWTQNFTAQ